MITAAVKTSQRTPPILAPEASTVIVPQETLTHGRKKQIMAIPAPAGVRNIENFPNLSFICKHDLS